MTEPLRQEDPRLVMMSALLQLEREVRRVQTRKELEFLVVNETHRLVPYRQAVLLLQTDMGSLDVVAVSSVALPDRNASYLLWLKQVILQTRISGLALQQCRDVVEVSRTDIPVALQAEWSEWGGQSAALWVPLLYTDGVLAGGLWLVRDTAWQNAEKALLERLADAYAHGFKAVRVQQNMWRDALAAVRARWRWALPVLVVLLLFPVRQSVLAPAQVVARNPVVVSAPYHGVIKQIHVSPNQSVKKDDLLFSLEDTELRNQYELALQGYRVAEARYVRAGQKAFADIDSKSELDMLKAEAEEKLAEANYADELLKRIVVHATQDGVAVFSDSNDWLGKPVNVGEKVMQLAAVQDTWLEIWLPVDDAIRLETGTGARFFLNVDPLHAVRARVSQTSYEAELSPQQVLSYRLKADFMTERDLPRLGLKGTAKLNGDRVPLVYYVFRRPLMAARRWLGW